MKKRMTMPTLMATLFFLISGLGSLQAQDINLFCNGEYYRSMSDDDCEVKICADNVLQEYDLLVSP